MSEPIASPTRVASSIEELLAQDEDRKPSKYVITDNATGVAFLNKPGHHSIAAVAWHVKADLTLNGSADPTGSLDVDAVLNITDCFKGVRLDFDYNLSTGKQEGDVSDSDSLENSLYKINVLIWELSKFRDAIKKSSELRAKLDEFDKTMCKETGYYKHCKTYEELLKDIEINKAIQKKRKDESKQSEVKEGGSKIESTPGSVGQTE